MVDESNHFTLNNQQVTKQTREKSLENELCVFEPSEASGKSFDTMYQTLKDFDLESLTSEECIKAYRRK